MKHKLVSLYFLIYPLLNIFQTYERQEDLLTENSEDYETDLIIINNVTNNNSEESNDTNLTVSENNQEVNISANRLLFNK